MSRWSRAFCSWRRECSFCAPASVSASDSVCAASSETRLREQLSSQLCRSTVSCSSSARSTPGSTEPFDSRCNTQDGILQGDGLGRSLFVSRCRLRMLTPRPPPPSRSTAAVTHRTASYRGTAWDVHYLYVGVGYVC